MAKKKLIVFIPSIEDGGVEKNLFIIVNYLSSKIENINLLTYDNKKKDKFKKKIKIKTPFINFIKFNNRYPKYFLCLLLLIRILLFDRNYTILTFQANIYVIIISKIFNIKVISRSNSSPSGWSNAPLKQSIFSYFFKKADKIIVNSYDFKSEMDKKYEVNVECILNPFLFKKIKKLSLQKAKKIYSYKCLKIISVGRLTDQKDFMTLFKAVENVKNKIVQLVIIGKGSNRSDLENFIIKKNLHKKIKMLGYKSNPFKYIKQADLFILTSKFEGSPNVLIEAQFLKKYIISTNCPTGPRVILKNGKLGSLVKVGDFKQISKIIENFKFDRKVKNKINLGFNNTKQYEYKINCLKYFKVINKFLY